MPSVFKVVPSGVLLQSWKSNRYIGCCYHCSFPPPQEHRRTWLTSFAVQLAVIPVFFLISCLLTVQKNKRPWPPTPHQPYQYLLKWLLVTESCHNMRVCAFWTVLFFRNRNHSFSFLRLSWHRIRSTETESSRSMAIDWRMMSWLSCIDFGCTYPAEEIKGSQTGPLKSEKDKGCRLHRDDHRAAIGNMVL